MSYNGHKNWNHQNVSLWINNDEGLYRFAKNCIKSTRNRREAAERFIEGTQFDYLRSSGMGCKRGHTPDGAPYTVTTVMAAMRGM